MVAEPDEETEQKQYSLNGRGQPRFSFPFRLNTELCCIATWLGGSICEKNTVIL